MIRAAPLVLVATLAACQPQVDLAGPAIGEPGAARDALVNALDEGPVPIVVVGQWPGLPADERDAFVSDALEGGVRGLSVSFAPVANRPAEGERLVVSLGRQHLLSPERLCDAGEGREHGSAGTGLAVAAAWCRGEEAIDAVAGTLADQGRRAQQRFLRRTAAALFPDDYAETYGFGILPDWLGVEAGGSVGF